MQTQIGKWGNSLALRFPQAFARAAHLEEGTSVELAIVDGQLLVRPESTEYRLADLLAGVTVEQCHPETNWGSPVGREIE